jgi:hypothetical protein
MPKLTATRFRVRASSDGYATLHFTGETGRDFEVRFPSSGLPGLVHHLVEVTRQAPHVLESVQLDEPILSSKQPGVRLDVNRPKHFVPGPHGGFEFGTSVDLSKVLLTLHVPAFGAIDLMMAPPTRTPLGQRTLAWSFQLYGEKIPSTVVLNPSPLYRYRPSDRRMGSLGNKV